MAKRTKSSGAGRIKAAGGGDAVADGRDDAFGVLIQRGVVRGRARRLAVVLGDQLDRRAELIEGLDRERDAVLMMEVDAEASGCGAGIRSHKARTAVFLAAMRRFAIDLVDRGYRVRYVRLDDPANTHDFTGEVGRAVGELKPESIAVTEPGEWRVLEMIEGWSESFGVPVEVFEDGHFLCSREEFSEWADGRKQLVMEYFYREMRRKLGVLVDDDGGPVGGAWNFDKENRESFTSRPEVPGVYRPSMDDVTRGVIALVNERYPDHPGVLDEDDWLWPISAEQAERALDRFIETRLSMFGRYEDAMWSGEPFLYHSLLSVALNLKLLDPRVCVRRAVEAYEAGRAPLASVEGFVRQIIGWREFIRGVYWFEGPGYRDRNVLEHTGELPGFYWTGETDMRCLRECLRPVIDHAYSHHIPRLMVLANFAMIAGVRARAIGDWFYEMYADAVDWVTTPNTIGMGVHADGGVVGTKPYAASGKYISGMSNYCKNCRYDVNKRVGDGEVGLDGETRGEACPFNTFYWDFLIRHRERFRKNQRMAMILKNVDRMKEDERVAITVRGRALRQRFGIASGV